MIRLARIRQVVASLRYGPRKEIPRTAQELDLLRAQLGDLQARAIARLPADAVRRPEFKVFSQFGDDGIIQFLISRVPIEQEVFVEFGVEDYRESNTRFLLVHDNWRGLVMDAGTTHREFLASSGLRGATTSMRSRPSLTARASIV